MALSLAGTASSCCDCHGDAELLNACTCPAQDKKEKKKKKAAADSDDE